MNHHATPAFWHAYKLLPAHIRSLADRKFELLKVDPKHPSLHFKQTGGFWSVRVAFSWRALAVAEGYDMVWFWIGSYADYDRILR